MNVITQVPFFFFVCFQRGFLAAVLRKGICLRIPFLFSCTYYCLVFWGHGQVMTGIHQAMLHNIDHQLGIEWNIVRWTILLLLILPFEPPSWDIVSL